MELECICKEWQSIEQLQISECKGNPFIFRGIPKYYGQEIQYCPFCGKKLVSTHMGASKEVERVATVITIRNRITKTNLIKRNINLLCNRILRSKNAY